MTTKASPDNDIIHSEFVHIIPNHDSELCNKLYQQWQDNQHCDLVISVKGGELRAHSCVVAAFSPKLKILLENTSRTVENRISVHLMLEMSVFRCLLNMMYSGVLSFNTTLLSSVMSTARWMQMDEVVRLCQEYEEVTGIYNNELMLTDDAVLCEMDAGEKTGEQVDTDQVEKQDKGGGGSKQASKPVKKSSRKRRNPAKLSGTPKQSSPDKRKRTQKSAKAMVKKEPEPDTNKPDSDTETTGGDPAADFDATDLPDDADHAEPSEAAENTPGPENTKKSPGQKRSQTGQKGKKTGAKKAKPSPKNKQVAKPASSGNLVIKSEKEDSSLLSHTQWVEAHCKDNTDKEEVDFAMGKTDHINCKRCMMKFTKLDEYFRHVTNHPTFTCDICVTTYYRKSNLTRHMRTNHSSQHHLRCSKCDFVAKTEKSLRNHFKDAHGDKNPFKCDYPDCTYATWKFDFLNRHSEIHSEVKRYICNKCGQGFAQHAGLMSHQRACYHLQQFLCDVCGQAFNHVQSMRAHRKTIHFGEKPYLCKTCGNQFSDQRNLKRHMRIHENSFPYQCPFCKQNYRHSNSLKAHLKKHGEASKGLDMVEIIQMASTGPRKKRAGSRRRTESLDPNESRESVGSPDMASRSEAGNMYLSNIGPSHRVEEMSDIVFPGRIMPKLESSGQYSDTNLQCRAELLEHLSSAANSSGSGLPAMVPLTAAESQHFVTENTSLMPSSLDRTVSIPQLSQAPMDSLLSMHSQMSDSGSSSLRLHPLMSTSSAAPAAMYSSELVTSGSTEGRPAAGMGGAEKNCEQRDGEGLSADKKSKGHSSYGLQTLAEICFNSSV